MALEIKAIPTLHGNAAKRFIELAEAPPEARRSRKKIRVDTKVVDEVLKKAGMS